MAIQFGHKCNQYDRLAQKRTHGMCRSVIPWPFLRNNHVNCLILDVHTDQTYNDNLFLFRALAVYLHTTTNLETFNTKIFNDFFCDSKQFNLPILEHVIIQTTCVKHLLALMPVNSILTPCVRICPQDCIRDRATMKLYKNSRQGQIEFLRLKV